MESLQWIFFSPMILSLAGLAAVSMSLIAYHIVAALCLTRRASTGLPTGFNLPPVDNTARMEIFRRIQLVVPILSFTSDPVDEKDCAICLAELEEGVNVRLLPICGHYFHVPCIDQWFSSHFTCPVCRSSPLLSPFHPRSICGGTDSDGNDDGASQNRFSESDETEEIATSPHFPQQNQTPRSSNGKGFLGRSLSLALRSDRNPPSASRLRRSLSLNQSHPLPIVIVYRDITPLMHFPRP